MIERREREGERERKVEGVIPPYDAKLSASIL
jgi:hypothetical protein